MKLYLKPFGRGGAVKLWEEKDDSLNELMTRLFVEQPLASPGSANYTDDVKEYYIFL